MVVENDDVVLAISPALEIGSEFALSSETALRPFLRGGASFLSVDEFDVRWGFAGAPSGVSPLTASTPLDDMFAEVGAGVDVVSKMGLNFRVEYDGRFSDDVTEHSAGLKGSINF